MYHRRNTCRCCGSGDLSLFLSLGPTPLANAFLKSEADYPGELSFPLDLRFCNRCSLVQICDIISPEVLFRDYIYVTGTSDTMALHNDAYAAEVFEVQSIQPGDLVVEAASNDGSLLSCFQRRGSRTVGIEPARNIAEMARARGIETVSEFFDAGQANRIRERFGPARSFIANNVLAHVDDPAGFLSAAASLLTDDGLAIIESPYIEGFAEGLEYDTVYHEHLSYFSAKALMHLCERNGMIIMRFDLTPVHGGSFRMYAGKKSYYGQHSAQALDRAAAEDSAGYHSIAYWENYAKRVWRNRELLRALLGQLHEDGKSLAAYGAPAKGNTLLNYCQIGTDWIPYTVDRSPLKVGKLTPGMHLPVLPVETLLERQPDYVLILPWNFASEIVRQQAEYLRRGGQFLLPLPDPGPLSIH
ncbi:MAG: class I SAM-dependent methyltransferase [Bryobacterales bacterium]|nr:class I SAM-dependent methyltransferase [Bryobacterales bacterium]